MTRHIQPLQPQAPQLHHSSPMASVGGFSSTQEQQQHRRTSSANGSFYFAYGSNLSYTQMLQRCPSSSRPLALAKLTSFNWFICNRGYANVIAVRPQAPERDEDAATVWGLIYQLTPGDERRLDGYEGWNDTDCGPVNPNEAARIWKPRLQGDCDYNKQYLVVEVMKWLVDGDPRAMFGLEEGKTTRLIRTLIYVDEVRLSPGRINDEYIPRMSRAVLESVPLGIPEHWVDHLMRQHGIVWSKGASTDKSHVASGDIVTGMPKDKWEESREKLLRQYIEAQERKV